MVTSGRRSQRRALTAQARRLRTAYPFVLSWSMLEAMAAGCLVLASATQPVSEVIRDGDNGLLVDFFDPERIAERVAEVLDHRDRVAEVRRRARAAILDRYALAEVLPRHLQLLEAVARRQVAVSL